jgi:hypothetical protein
LKESKNFHFKWLDHIFRICNSTGMNYLSDSKELESSHQCIKLQFKRISQDQCIQSWLSDMNNSSRGQCYCMFKNEFKLELYLLKLSQVNFTWLCKLRTCNTKIPIETGKWVNIPRKKDTENLATMALVMSFIIYSLVNVLIYICWGVNTYCHIFILTQMYLKWKECYQYVMYNCWQMFVYLSCREFSKLLYFMSYTYIS